MGACHGCPKAGLVRLARAVHKGCRVSRTCMCDCSLCQYSTLCSTSLPVSPAHLCWLTRPHAPCSRQCWRRPTPALACRAQWCAAGVSEPVGQPGRGPTSLACADGAPGGAQFGSCACTGGAACWPLQANAAAAHHRGLYLSTDWVSNTQLVAWWHTPGLGIKQGRMRQAQPPLRFTVPTHLPCWQSSCWHNLAYSQFHGAVTESCTQLAAFWSAACNSATHAEHNLCL